MEEYRDGRLYKNGFAIHSVSQGHRAKVKMIHKCGQCGEVYGEVEVGEFYFTEEYGPCDCGWDCCEASRPRAKNHQPHMVYVEA